MYIKDMFKSDINRQIDKVIKVDQLSQEKLYQEVTEYVITKEIRRNFNDFFNAYEKSIDSPNENIGVWISGFFGSGKSHFLKMLAYILTNKLVKDKPTIEYFKDKFNDPMMYSSVERCVKKKTDAIMFDIFYVGSATGGKLDLVTVFMKEFYDYLGYYGTDLKVARFEKFLDDQGKYEEFKDNFKQIHQDDWDSCRDTFSFFEDEVVEAYMKTLNCSEIAARNWFNNEETIDINIEKLINEISTYVNKQGEDFRLLFMIDEMGAYIGENLDYMVTLQSIVEKLGVMCKGKVWVMVTGQEAIDSVVKVKGGDLSKILARFDIKLKLSSSSTDEVIKKRILEKTEAGKDTLKLSYAKNSAILKNLYTFSGNAVSDLKGYANEEDFVESYPFVSYQFIIEQKILEKIRVAQFAGASLSSGERTMLAAFQLAAAKIQNQDENALVPLYSFYSIVDKDLDFQVRQVFERCQKAADNNDGIEQYDVNVLKLLFLIRNIDDFVHNIENITVLMIDDIRTDKINLRVKVQNSLERLHNQNYISKEGDVFDFLTNEEQEVSKEIRSMAIDSASIIRNIGDIIFGDLYMGKKFRYKNNGIDYDIEYDKIIDDTYIVSSTGGVKLRIVTDGSDIYKAGESTWIMRSSNEAYVVLSDTYKYFDELEDVAKVKKYVDSKNLAQVPEAIVNIIKAKQQQATNHKKNAKTSIEKAIMDATFVINGQKLTIKGTNVKEKLDNTMTYLVESVYSKIDYIKHNFSSDEEIKDLLQHNQGLAISASSANVEAVNEIETFLTTQQARFLPTSMSDILKRFTSIPYGWKEIDIAACVAELIKNQKIQIKRSGNIVSPLDRNIVDYLRKRSEIENVAIEKRVSPNPELIRNARNILKEYFRTMDIPSSEDDLVDRAITDFSEEKDECTNIISYYSSGNYPQREVVEKAIKLYEDILNRKNDNQAFLTAIVSYKDNLYALLDELEDIKQFFKTQKSVFDKGLNTINNLKDEETYIDANEEAANALQELKNIISMEKPYSEIRNIPNLIQIIDNNYNSLLENKRKELVNYYEQIKDNLYSNVSESNTDIYQAIVNDITIKQSNIESTNKITILDATKSALGEYARKDTLKLLNTDKEKPVTISQVLNADSIVPKEKITKDNVDEYINKVKDKINKLLEDNDEITII